MCLRRCPGALCKLSAHQRITIIRRQRHRHFFGALRIDGFIDKDEFKSSFDDWIQVFRNTKPAPGTNGPLIPRDPEREAEAIRSKEGIPLINAVVDDLLDVSKKTGIPFEMK